MAKTFSHRANRFLTSCTSVDIIGAGTMIAVIAGTLFPPTSTAMTAVAAATYESPALLYPLFVIALAVLSLLAFRAKAEYQRRTYDPTWVLKFDEIFNSESMKIIRGKAAKSLIDNRGNLANDETSLPDLDDVLNILDTVGFYEHGHQITPEVAHHHFHYWVHGYYQAAHEYIEWCESSEPTVWEFIKELYDMTNSIEIERSGGKRKALLDEKRMLDFLEDEIKPSGRKRD